MRRLAAATGSAVFFAVAPGVVAGLIPWALTGWHVDVELWMPLRVIGAAMIVIGVPVLVQAFARFVTEGMGTPAPIAPPEHLVIGGLYRYVRNPMYVAIVTIILGQALLVGRMVLVVYAAAAFAVMAAFVRFYEEPTLSELFGEEYARYRHAVRAWIPRVRPWNPDTG